MLYGHGTLTCVRVTFIALVCGFRRTTSVVIRYTSKYIL